MGKYEISVCMCRSIRCCLEAVKRSEKQERRQKKKEVVTESSQFVIYSGLDR